MRPIAYNQIILLSNELTNPTRASWLMRDYMKKAIQLTKNTVNKNTILKFNKAKVGFKDVENIAECVVSKLKCSDKSREAKYEIVKDFMKHKLNDAIKCTKCAKKELNISNECLSKTVRKGTLVRREYMELVDKELDYVWKEAKVKSQEKVVWNVNKHIKKDDKKNGTFKGILVGDSELEKLEQEMVEKIENKAIVYAGLKVSKNEEEILTLPPDYAIFPKVSLEEFDTDMEKCIIKCKWEVNQEQRKSEQKKVIEEVSEDGSEDDRAHKVVSTSSGTLFKNTSAEKFYDNDTKTLDFRNLKDTDLKNNKRVVLPELDDDPEEIRRNNLKGELRKVVLEYKKNHCDKFGNIHDNNLNKEKLKDIKDLKNRMKTENLACGETDKTGKLTLDTVDNISKKMNKHIKDDKILNAKEVKRLENKVNKHMDFWCGILKHGEKKSQRQF